MVEGIRSNHVVGQYWGSSFQLICAARLLETSWAPNAHHIALTHARLITNTVQPSGTNPSQPQPAPKRKPIPHTCCPSNGAGACPGTQ